MKIPRRTTPIPSANEIKNVFQVASGIPAVPTNWVKFLVVIIEGSNSSARFGAKARASTPIKGRMKAVNAKKKQIPVPTYRNFPRSCFV